MLDIAALTGGTDVPSARFRVRQHIAPLTRLGVRVREHIPVVGRRTSAPPLLAGGDGPAPLPVRAALSGLRLAARLPGILASHGAAGTWINKELVPGRPTLERLCRRPVFLDVDDAIWLGSRRMADVARRVDVVIAGNGYIADWFAQHADQIEVVPTAIDTDRFRPNEAAARDDFVIGWTGTADNLPYLEALEPVFHELFRRHADISLSVVCDRAPRFTGLEPGRVWFRPWAEGMEAEALQGLGVGLMPLPDTPWARGKCSFKMLQYMASGVPVVASPVGMNAEVLAMGDVGAAASTHEEWVEALESLYRDPALRRTRGQGGRTVVEEHFAVSVIAPRLAEIFRRYAGGARTSYKSKSRE